MKKITLLFVTVVFLASCTEEDLVEIKPDTTLKFTISDSTNLALQTTNAETYNLLGHGYDATGFFFNGLSGKAKVLEMEKLIEVHPGHLSSGYPQSHYSCTDMGLSAQDLVRVLSGRTDSYFRPITDSSKTTMFCGQLTTAFDRSILQSDQYSFAFYQEFILKRSFAYYEVTDTLRKYVTEAFKTDIQNESPDYILKKYGTHVLTGVLLGAKIQVLYATHIPSGDKSWLLPVGLSRATLCMMGRSMSYSETQSSFTNQNQEICFSTTGGKRMIPWSGTIATDTLSAPLVDMEPWFSSTESNWSLIDVPESHMIPIYELVIDVAKREALKNAYNTYFLKSKANLMGL
jgi:hypothetical protein